MTAFRSRGRPRLRATRAYTVRVPETAAGALGRLAQDLGLASGTLAALALLEGLEALRGLGVDTELPARVAVLARRRAAP